MKRYIVQGSMERFNNLEDAKAEAKRIGANQIFEYEVIF